MMMMMVVDDDDGSGRCPHIWHLCIVVKSGTKGYFHDYLRPRQNLEKCCFDLEKTWIFVVVITKRWEPW